MKKSTLPHGAATRRRFLQAGGLAGAGVTTFSQAAASSAFAEGPVLETAVLVCGGGCAGLAAALAAARNGADTLLVERSGFAGGIITSVGLPFFDGIAHIKDKRIVVRGIALELLTKSGVVLADDTHVTVHNPVIRNIERFKLLADQLITSEKTLRVLYHSTACGVTMEGDRIAEVLVANKAGIMRIRPGTVIDCTGDGDIAHWSGAPTEQNAEVQPLTLHFRIGHVKPAKDLRKKCLAALEAAHARGELPMFYGPGIMFMFAADEIYVHAVRVPANPVDPFDFTRAEMQGRRDVWAMFEAWKKDVPEFQDAYFISSGPCIGVRESRRLVGQHVLTEEEVMKTKAFDDAIATGCWYLDLHPNKATVGSANDFKPEKVQPEPYDIPYRSLLPRRVANLLVAGRCHSATRMAHSSTRVSVTAMAMGQAAATAAALAVKQKRSPQEIDGRRVRDLLKQQGGGAARDWA